MTVQLVALAVDAVVPNELAQFWAHAAIMLADVDGNEFCLVEP